MLAAFRCAVYQRIDKMVGAFLCVTHMSTCGSLGEPMTYVTDEMRKLIGVRAPRQTAAESLGREGLRRLVQGAMEENPIHQDEAAGRRSRFGSVVAPPLYPMHALRRPNGTPDPFDRLAEDRDDDGLQASRPSALARIDFPLARHLNGGSEIEFYQLAEIGDVISAVSWYECIEEKETASGTIVLETIATEYTKQGGEVLIRVSETMIHR